MLSVNELLLKIEKVAPLSLSGEYCKKFGSYDNSGVIVDCGNDVRGVLFTLDLTPTAVNRAIELGYNCIVTHHPAIFGGIKNIVTTRNPLANSIARCIKNDISIISMHLNMDVAERGVDHHLMCALGGKDATVLEELSSGGYGRLFKIEPTTANKIDKKARQTLRTNRTILYDLGGSISKVISFCGAGSSDNAVALAIANKADLFVSAEIKHHHLLTLIQSGICVLQLTHYASENYSFETIFNDIKNWLEIPSEYYTEDILL